MQERNSAKKLFDNDKASPRMVKGPNTGSVGAGLPTAMNAGLKKSPIAGFPMKGRKPFVCPSKIVESKKDTEESDQEDLP
jgi:hypothetical protein